MEIFTIALVIVFILSSIITFSNQYFITRILRNNGEATLFLFFLPSDYNKFKMIIKDEQDTNKKNKMRSLQKWYSISLGITFVCFIILIVIAFTHKPQ